MIFAECIEDVQSPQDVHQLVLDIEQTLRSVFNEGEFNAISNQRRLTPPQTAKSHRRAGGAPSSSKAIACADRAFGENRSASGSGAPDIRTIEKAVTQALRSGPTDTLIDIHELARAKMLVQARQAEQEGRVEHHLVGTHFQHHEPMAGTLPFCLDEAEQAYRQLIPHVRSAFKGVRPQPDGYTEHGRRLSPHRLSHALAGNKAIFVDYPLRRQRVANVSVLVDASWSMKVTFNHLGREITNMQAANASAYALARALTSMPLVNVRVDYFTSAEDRLAIYRACDFGQKPQPVRFCQTFVNGTPTAEAMQFTLFNALYDKQQPKDNHYFVLITDAYIGECETLSRVLTHARGNNIKLMAIGIVGPTRAVQSNLSKDGLFRPHETIGIASVSELPNAFKTFIHHTLFSTH